MLYNMLKEYAASGVYPMHMPGHKRNTELLPPGLPYEVDVSEIHGFDNLHDAKGILRDTAEIAARIYGSDRAFPLVNGSTAGIIAAIGAQAGRGDKILMARNCHLSVYNAVALFGISPVYIVPKVDEATGIACSIEPADVESMLEADPEVKLVVVTSPTYEGVVSDIGSIAGVAHSRGVPLMVDSAHGAHLGFSAGFPESAVKSGADVVVMSLHKTLPALTQCALLHICSGLADKDEIARMLAVLQTSSPSYVLMASIDCCLRLLETDGDRLFREYERNLEQFGREAGALEKLAILRKIGGAPHPDIFALDPGRIVITTKKTALSGVMLADILREEHKIELEMESAVYAVAITGVCDTAEGFARLSGALVDIDRSLPGGGRQGGSGQQEHSSFVLPEQKSAPGDALKRRGDFIPLAESIGAVSLEYVWAYPPGAPVLAPGEIINADTVSYIGRMIRAGIAPKSTRGRLPEAIYAFSPS